MIRWGLATTFIAALGACERSAADTRGHVAPLKTLAAAQAHFKAGDLDGNGASDFWRKDVRGLSEALGYNGLPLGLIDPSIAAADAHPASAYGGDGARAPKGGYWYKAIPHAGEVEPNLNRFAFCAYPDDYGFSGKDTYLIDEGNTLFRKDLGHGRGIEVFPADLEKEGWLKHD